MVGILFSFSLNLAAKQKKYLMQLLIINRNTEYEAELKRMDI